MTLGTMRLPGDDDTAAADLLAHARDIGIRGFHCSAEYATFPLFAAAWARAGLARADATLIAKVASPHFGEDRFSATRFREKIEAYLQALDVERLDVVQWLLRHDLKAEEARLRILREAEGEIASVVDALRAEGKIGGFIGFPYTRPVADALVAADWCDGVAVYLNPVERGMDAVVAACADRGKAVVAIRPFAAGRVFAETSLTADDALRHVFDFPAVATAVVSASSRAHLDVLRPWSAG
ncbi:MAG TPA: aldo/keto reductase [Sphingomonas sp.]|uniref:aldo/keto reductase n=1 Tax=Sphingomonas sp. TaxID=28214 RepID=UPI002ED87E01